MTPPAKVEVRPLRVEDDTWLPLPDDISARAQPIPSAESEAFWQGLAAERIVLQCCLECGKYTHFPVPGCASCGSPRREARPVDGEWTVYTFSVCYLEFGPGTTSPYVVAHVELSAQPGLRIVTNLVNCRIADIRIGMRVRPRFVMGGTGALVFFEPERREGEAAGR